MRASSPPNSPRPPRPPAPPRPTHARGRGRGRSLVRSRRLRSQGRIPKSDGDVKEAHRRTYQDNESLRSTPVDVVRADDAVARDSERNDVYTNETNEPDETSQTNEPNEEPSARPPSPSSSQQSPNTQRASILIDILSTAPLNIEAKIADYAESIDPELLHLLEGRIAAARQLEQDQETVDGLVALYYRLKSEYDRRTASPALRLLDTLLSMMLAEDDDDDDDREADAIDVDSDSDDGEYTEGDGKRRRRRRIPASREDRVALVRARMQLAFDESLSLDTDVFTVAQQLAVGERRFVDELINEQVDGGEFVKEVEGLLKRAMEQQVAGNALLADGEQGTGERAPGERAPGERAPGERERLRQALEQRERTIECVEELLVLARGVWYRQRN